MKQTKWFFHPILILIFSILALATSLFLYIYWYIEVSTGLKSIVQRFNLESGQFLEYQTWVVIMVLSILVGIILMGIFIIFVYNLKTYHLYRLQHNFINNFTHELKTPVTSLKLYLETFRKHDLSREDQLNYISYMIHDVSRLSDNINRILNLAKIESKAYGGEFILSDLALTIQRFCENNIHLFQGCEIEIHNPSKRLFLYPIDPPLFEMLLMNILNNAVKYNTAPVPRVDITFTPVERRLRIDFKDNGIGISKAEIKKVFKKFYQVGRADNMTAKGSGLGLYLAENVARLHKFRISAASDGIGHGSIFSLTVPIEA
jgi:signal transduction histidine kinase